MKRRGRNKAKQEIHSDRKLPRFVRVRELCAKLGVTRQGLYKMRLRGDLPPAVRIAPNTIAWAEDVLIKHFDSRPAA